jgi:heme oxygenase
MAAASESPSGRLRNAVRECHVRLDKTAYALAVTDASLPLPQYASFLRALYALHDGLEQLVEISGSPTLRAAYAAGPAQRERLERDLTFLNTDRYGVDVAALHALVLAQQVRLRMQAPRGESSLLGTLYVIEGSQRGGLAQARSLARRPELQRGGLSYLKGVGSGTTSSMHDLYALLDELLYDEAELAAAIDGAKRTFAGFEAILNAVMSETTRMVEALNAAAGAHPVPRDLREVHAALAAGDQSRADFSYYEARYGERGRRFTRSDSAWLVTLSRLPASECLRQVSWLARLLAARGMPRLLLERHLELLHAQLLSTVPAGRETYAVLLEAAGALARERRERVSDARFQELAAQLPRLYQLQSNATPPIPSQEAGLLLAAAVVDEACGVPQAVESLCRWLTDTTRASQGFCTAVDHALRSARAALAARPHSNGADAAGCE